MRTLKLKEVDTDVFLRLENAPKGTLLVVEQSGTIVSQVLLNLKQMAHVSEWMVNQTNDIIKRNKVTSKESK